MSDARPVEIPARPGEFERYGLLAAVTLVVLCLLLADRLRPSARRVDLPPSDRLVRVEVGGDRPAPVVAPPVRRAEPQTPLREAALPPPRETVRQEPPPAPPPPEPRVHVVRPGETLVGIARSELGSARRVQEIVTLNGLADPDLIRAGQSLRLPPK